MSYDFEEKRSQTIWAAQQLFNRKLVTGSTGNISFQYEGNMYISKSGSCFGRLDENSFAVISLSGEILEGKPSKEFPIHLSIYNKNKDVGAVIHTHSLYSTTVSCMQDTDAFIKGLYSYTPYLKILTKGMIGIVPYYAPGSEKLFKSFSEVVNKNINVYLLNNHGLVVAADNAYNAFNIIEEFEVSAQIQYILSQYQSTDVRKI
jgi:3-dehydro-4-phosphotetronate decarboxylase